MGTMLVLLVGCGTKAADEPSGTAREESSAAVVTPTYPVVLELRAPDRIRVGKPVPLKLTLRNVGPDSVLVTLGGKPTNYDFVVTRLDGKEVWSTPRDGMLAVALERTLAPGGVLDFEKVWDQRDFRGEQVPPGSYQVRGILWGGPETMRGPWETEPKPLVAIP